MFSWFLFGLSAGVISKNFNKGALGSTLIKWVWPICSHAHISKDDEMIIYYSYDILKATSRKISIAM